MVYEYYIKRGSKKFGPYYYRSYRVGNKVKKEYLGTNNGKRFSRAIPWRIILVPVRKIKDRGVKVKFKPTKEEVELWERIQEAKESGMSLDEFIAKLKGEESIRYIG